MIADRPQRIASPTGPGLLLKHTHRMADRLRRHDERAQDPQYLALVRQLPCLKCGLDPCGTAAHVRMNSGLFNKRQAVGRKPADKWTVPLCAACHLNDADSQHRIGELAFWHGVGINPLRVCDALYAQRGDLVAMRAVIFQAIATRGPA
jgi:hypothetical protein